MDTKLYLYFMKVASLQSVSKAAEKLFITQPALSRYIAQLEKEIGVPLFNRQGKGMELNDSGKLLYNFLEREQITFERLLKDIRRKGKQAKRTAIIDIQNVIKVPGLMRHISLEKAKDFPSLNIVFQTDQLYLLRKRLISGEVDLIFTGDKVIEHIPDIVIERIARFPLCISYSTAMFNRKEVTISDFENKDLLLYDPGDSNENYKYFLLEICNRLGIHPQIKYVQNGDILRTHITNGLGFTIEPKTFNSLSENASVGFLPTDTEIWVCLGRLKGNNHPEIIKLQNEIVCYCKNVLSELSN